MFSESTKGSESRGASEEEDEWAGVLAAPALPYHPLPYPQQARKGALPPPTLFIYASRITELSPLDGDVCQIVLCVAFKADYASDFEFSVKT